MLVWDFLYPNRKLSISVYHIGMKDINNFSNKETEPFCVAFKSFKINFNDLINLKEKTVSINQLFLKEIKE